MRDKKGFTLIELLVVISIIALLLAIVLPAMKKVKAQAKITICKTRLKNLGTATIAYASSGSGKLPVSFWTSSATLTDGAWRSYVMKEISNFMGQGRINIQTHGTEVFGFGILWQNNYLDDPDIFVCTETKKEDLDMGLFTQRLYNFEDRNKAPRVDAQYSYVPLSKKTIRNTAGTVTAWPHAKKSDELATSAPLCMDKIRHENDFAHRRSTSDSIPLVNVCFGDGHVTTSANEEYFTPAKLVELRGMTSYAIPAKEFLEFLVTVKP